MKKSKHKKPKKLIPRPLFVSPPEPLNEIEKRIIPRVDDIPIVTAGGIDEQFLKQYLNTGKRYSLGPWEDFYRCKSCKHLVPDIHYRCDCEFNNDAQQGRGRFVRLKFMAILRRNVAYFVQWDNGELQHVELNT